MDQHNDTLDARKRRRETLQNGEYIAFDLSLMDSASASKSVFMTDSAPAVAVRFAELVDAAKREHFERFAFMGDNAPAFDRQAAEMAARNTIYSEGARASINAIRDARYQGPATTAAPTPGQSAPAAYSPRQVSDALRAARYR